MKKLSAIFKMLVIVLIVSSCTPKPVTNTHVSLLVDLTGSYQDNVPDVDSDKILQLFHLNDTQNYGTFRTDYIADVNYSTVQKVSLRPVASMIEYNEFEREAEVVSFKEKITSMIGNVNGTPRGKPNSAVYIPIAREINRIARTHADRKVVIIYSDLFENSTFFRFYEPKSLQLLLEKPEEVQRLLEKQQPLAEDLTGVHVYIVYQAPNQEASQAFQLFSNRVYKPMLEERGAEVIIGANLVL